MTIVNFHSILTVAGITAFIALVVWAFSKGQKSAMDAHARIPLEDDHPVEKTPQQQNPNA